MSEQIKNYKLNGKDLIGAGIYSAIYFAISFVGMVMGIIPILWIVMPGVIAILAGIPFMLLCAKVRKPGTSLIMGIITGLLYFMTGQFTMVILATFVIGCTLSELTRFKTNYNSFKGNTVAFIFFSYGMVGSPLPIWLFKDEFFSQIASQGLPPDFMDSLQAVSSNFMLVLLLVSPIIGGILGAVIYRGMFKKHFKKAGMV